MGPKASSISFITRVDNYLVHVLESFSNAMSKINCGDINGKLHACNCDFTMLLLRGEMTELEVAKMVKYWFSHAAWMAQPALTYTPLANLIQ